MYLSPVRVRVRARALPLAAWWSRCLPARGRCVVAGLALGLALAAAWSRRPSRLVVWPFVVVCAWLGLASSVSRCLVPASRASLGLALRLSVVVVVAVLAVVVVVVVVVVPVVAVAVVASLCLRLRFGLVLSCLVVAAVFAPGLVPSFRVRPPGPLPVRPAFALVPCRLVSLRFVSSRFVSFRGSSWRRLAGGGS